MDGIENREAYFVEVLAYTKYGQEPVTFVSKTAGKLAKVKSGEFGWSWDFVIQIMKDGNFGIIQHMNN